MTPKQPQTGRASALKNPLITFVAALAFLPGCSRETAYPQDTPDAVIQSAVSMVQAGEAERLPDLIEADNEAMRATLDRMGRLLGRLQSLSEVMYEKFPQEIEAAKSELADEGLGIRMPGFGGRRSGRAGGDIFNDALRRLFADPYAWANESADRLSTLPLTEDTAAIMFDERAVLPPFGLTMRRGQDIEGGDDWHIVAPINLPIVSRFMPKTDKQWAIVAYLFEAAENATIDLEEGIRSGEIVSLKDAAREAGTMLFAPAAAIGVAYGQTIKEQREAEKAEAENDAEPDPGGS